MSTSLKLQKKTKIMPVVLVLSVQPLQLHLAISSTADILLAEQSKVHLLHLYNHERPAPSRGQPSAASITLTVFLQSNILAQ